MKHWRFNRSLWKRVNTQNQPSVCLTWLFYFPNKYRVGPNKFWKGLLLWIIHCVGTRETMNKQVIYQVTAIYKIFRESDFTSENLPVQTNEGATFSETLIVSTVFAYLFLRDYRQWTVLKPNFLDLDNIYKSKSKHIIV